MTSLPLADEAATEALGHALALPVGDLPADKALILFLVGTLGAGKTTLARGLLRQLGVRGHVRSPTFTLVETYAVGELTVVHIDLYRIDTAVEVDGLGLREFDRPSTLWLVEWPQKGAGFLPAQDIELTLSIAQRDTRLAGLTGCTATGKDWVKRVLQVCEAK